MSGILERTFIMGRVILSGKRERLVPFPWEYVSSGVANGWEPAEWLPMGRVNDVNELARKANVDILCSNYAVRDYVDPYFYDGDGIILHGGYVQIV